MSLTTIAGREKERQNEKETLVEDEEKPDGAFTDLTKQFKRLNCPFNALKRLAEERKITITEIPCLEWTEIIQTSNQKVAFSRAYPFFF